MAQFANLPDDCYHLIFVRLSTSTLLSCRRVSRAWLRNQQKVCRSRRTLVLQQGKSPTQLLTSSHFQSDFISHGIDQNGQPMKYELLFVQHNTVNLLSFDLNVTHFLAETFPNMDTLIVVHDDIPSQSVNKPLLDLLQLYSSRVVTLKLYFNYRAERTKLINSNILKVIRQLNSMSALEHVTIELPCLSSVSLKMCNRKLQFLTRIKQFYFYSSCTSPSWLDGLRRLEQAGAVSQLERIAIGDYMWPRSLHNWPLADRFTHFPGIAYFDKSIVQFRSLTTFNIDDYGTRTVAYQLTALSQHCPSLVHISMIISKNSMFALPFDPSTIKPLESVKALDLTFEYYHPTRVNIDAHVHPLVHTFPNLVSIKIMYTIQKPNNGAEFPDFFRKLKTAFRRESLRTDYSSYSIFY